VTARFLILLSVVGLPAVAHGYVGPGAGFALAGSFWTILILLLAVLSMLVLPFRFALVWYRRRKSRGSRARRVVVIGLDGLDPGLTQRWMGEGRLPNLQKLADQGVFKRLGTTLPAITPAAWSSFATGTDPSRHNIFDFITRDPQTYQPVLSSARVTPARRSLKVGPYRIPISRPRIRNLKRSQPFWKLLGERNIFSSILRVPITFPPEPFNGHLLAGMCVPDLRGTQGEFTYLKGVGGNGEDGDLGSVIHVSMQDGHGRARVPGPADPFGGNGDASSLYADIELEMDAESRGIVLKHGKQRIALARRTYSPWVELSFKAGFGVRVNGICQFYLVESDPLMLYATSIQIDPDRPSLPLSHPASYAAYLCKRLGKFATLGLAEDTEALNADVIDERAFLDQAYSLHAERERMLFHALEKTQDGLVVCVFDGPDRIQHMFFRTLDPQHPANEGKEVAAFAQVVPEMYEAMDDLVGRVMARVGGGAEEDTTLMVISDHGFCQFKRGINLNTWLLQNDYLVLKDGAAGGEAGGDEWFAGVDWTKTRAFALGLTGIFINRRGREASGTVAEDDVSALKREVITKLEGLVDDGNGADGQLAIRKVWDTDAHFDGPYKRDAPDLLIGYNAGYRASWNGAKGQVTESVFEDNTRLWSGDHCVDPEQVPGVFFCNRPVSKADPHLFDVPLSILKLFGVNAPSYMQGDDLFDEAERAAS